MAAPAATHIGTKPDGAALQTPPDQPPAKLVIDSPLPEPLSRGVVFVRYRTDNLDLLSVFGSSAVAVSPRIGHIHVTVNGARWYWEEATRNPVIIQGLSPGQHRILIELTNADHKVIDQGTLEVTIPDTRAQRRHSADAR
jgi:hypothetical protein